MSGVIKIEILETVDELRQLLQTSQTKEVKERVQALYWLKSGQVQTTKAIAGLIGKHRVTVSRWLSSYKEQGINALLTKGKSTGRNKKLSPPVEASLKQELTDEPGFSSYKEIQIWLRVVHDVEMSYTGVHQLVRYKLKAKLKVPRPVHVKQEVGVVKDFKKN
jgi:transposase